MVVMHNYMTSVICNGLLIVLARWFAQPSWASVVALLLGLESHTFVRDPTRRRTSKFFYWLNRGRSHNRWLYWLSCRRFRAVRVWLDGDSSRTISSSLTGVALRLIVGVKKYVLLNGLADVAPVLLQDSSAGWFDPVGAWLWAFLGNATGFLPVGDRVPCADVLSTEKSRQVCYTTSVMALFGGGLSLVEASAIFFASLTTGIPCCDM